MGIYFETYGCPLNLADTHTMIELLRKAGFSITNKPEEAEAIVINSCTVKTPTEHRILKRLKELKKLKKPIILAGCLPQAETDISKLKDYSLIGTMQINRIVEVVEETINGNTVILIAKEKLSRKGVPHARKNKIIEIIPICQGCTGNCTYCKVKAARGDLFSYEPRAILKTMEQAINSGAKEIWLTAQDTGSYGLDINTNIVELLNLAINIQGDFKIRLGMANPEHVYTMLKELIEVYKSPKMFKFLHVPVQSGSNDILKRMGRKYNIKQFINIVNSFKKEIKDITIATDVIVGFPGETKKQFQHTLKLLKEIKPDVLNISRFWPREGTAAVKFKGYSGALTKARSREITKLFNEIAFQNNLKWLNRKCNVLFDEEGKYNSWIGRNDSYKPVIVLSDENLLGKKANVKIIDVTRYDLRGKILEKLL